MLQLLTYTHSRIIVGLSVVSNRVIIVPLQALVWANDSVFRLPQALAERRRVARSDKLPNKVSFSSEL